MIENTFPAFGVLLVDDEPAWLDSLGLSLERTAGINNITQCSDSRRVLDILSGGDFGLVLLDLIMPHCSGQEILKLVTEQHPEVKVIVLTGMNQLETAVDCMKLGAFDYFVKTEEEQHLGMRVLQAIRMIELQRENREMSCRLLDDTLEHPEAFAKILTVSKTMRSVFQYIESIARSSQPIMITGESGAGKELIAQAVHTLSGRKGRLVSVNIAGLDDSMFADTLFGHVRGAYTGAEGIRGGLIDEAEQGTLFLDEIGDLNTASQVKLLRMLNDGEYFPLGSDKPKRSKTRIIVATNQDLTGKIEEGRFRKDLYYRLRIHRVQLPPLRERKEDIPLLLEYFLEEAAKDIGKAKPAITQELLYLLESYSFPGNIRELRSMIYDAVTCHRSGLLHIAPFLEAMGKPDLPSTGAGTTMQDNIFSNLNMLPTPEQTVEMLVDEAMKRSHGNQSLAARLIGMTQSALNKRLKRTGKR